MIHIYLFHIPIIPIPAPNHTHSQMIHSYQYKNDPNIPIYNSNIPICNPIIPNQTKSNHTHTNVIQTYPVSIYSLLFQYWLHYWKHPNTNKITHNHASTQTNSIISIQIYSKHASHYSIQTQHLFNLNQFKNDIFKCKSIMNQHKFIQS